MCAAMAHLANEDGSSEQRSVAQLLDGALCLLRSLVFDDTVSEKGSWYMRVSNWSSLASTSLLRPTHPQPLDMPLGRERTSEKTTLPAAIQSDPCNAQRNPSANQPKHL